MAVEEIAMPDTPEFDGQDMAEIWDEDNQNTDEDRLAGADDGFSFETQPDLYDATRAVGDEDDEDALIGDDLDDEDIVELAQDDDDDDAEDDDLRARSADAYDDEDVEELDFDGEDPDLDDRVARLGKDEVELEDDGDLNNREHALGSAKRFEAARLSDEDIDRLGYGKDGASTGKDSLPGHPKSFDPTSERTAEEGERHAKQDELLDEGVEETFPASDPVSVKHIT